MYSAKSVLLSGSLLISASCLSTASHAAIVFSDNFNTENGGASALQYTKFTNWTVTGTGVDLVHTPDFGITCAGGSGSCVDLDGSPGPGGLTSKLFYSFNAGDHVKLTFEISGSQRSGLGIDPFSSGFTFGSATTIHDLTFVGPTITVDFGDFTTPGVEDSQNANGNSFSTYSLSFTAGTAGTTKILFATTEAGDIGPLLDNVSLDISGVPEPETWAMLVLGVFGIGAMLRLARQKFEISTQPV